MTTQSTPETQAEIERHARELFSLASLAAPIWIDDSTLAVLDDRSGVPQVSVLDVTTGTLEQRTSFPERVLSLLGKPGAADLIFGMDVGGNERQQIWRLPTGGGEPVRLTSDDETMHEPGCVASDGATLVYRSNERNPALFDIYGSNIRAFDPMVWMDADGMPYPIDASSERKQVLVGRLNTNLDTSLLLLDPQAQTIVDLLPHEGEASIKAASFARGESIVWVVSNVDREFHRVLRIDLDTRERSEFYAEDWDIELLSLSPDESKIAIAVNEDGYSVVRILDATTAQLLSTLDLERGVADRLSWSPDSRSVALGLSTPTRPGRIVVATIDGAMRIFDAEPDRDIPTLPDPEIVRYRSFDSREVPAYWFTPAGKGPWPVIIDVHGGPESQRRLNFQPIVQLWLSLGVAVLATNVRGSTGYGKEYCHLDDVELRLDSVRDLAEAATWLRARSDVDGDRIAVMGQSYGGFMTLAAITFHPDLWRAAVNVVGIANFVSFLERTGPWRVKHRAYEYGNLEEHRDFLEQVSPLTHVDRIQTPLFVIHGRNDPRVPLYEAEQIVEAVGRRGLPVEIRVYDDEGHGLSKRTNRIDGYSAAAAFVLAEFAKP
jgi:dipeptidyl aminopeptidase/acylaminoacyl peptidase